MVIMVSIRRIKSSILTFYQLTYSLLSRFFSIHLSFISMAANVTSGNTYIIKNVKAGTAVDLSVGDNRTGISCPNSKSYLVLTFELFDQSPAGHLMANLTKE